MSKKRILLIAAVIAASGGVFATHQAWASTCKTSDTDMEEAAIDAVLASFEAGDVETVDLIEEMALEASGCPAGVSQRNIAEVSSGLSFDLIVRTPTSTVTIGPDVSAPRNVNLPFGPYQIQSSKTKHIKWYDWACWID